MRILLALLCLAAALPARAEQDETVLPEASRWLSFVRLVEARWRERVQVPPDAREERAELYTTCVDDAWYLARPTMLAGARSACGRLVEGLAVAQGPKKATPARVDWKARAKKQGGVLSLDDYRACTREASDRGDDAVLESCSETLRNRASVVASLPDEDRFRTWMTGCKKAMLGPIAPPAPNETTPAAAPPPVPDADEHARHCLRTLPTLYEVQWMRKLGDFWTPEEQRLLYLRTQQLNKR